MPISFLVLFAAILAVWLPLAWRQVALWQVLLPIALLAALVQGYLTPVGLLPVLALVVTVALALRAGRRLSRAGLSGWPGSSGRSRRFEGAHVGWLWLTALLAVALATHRLPGFQPFLVTEMQPVSPSSVPISVRAHIDKGVAGLLLLAWFCRRSVGLARMAWQAGIGFAVGVVTAVPVITLVVAAGAVHWEPKLPPITLQWLAINLFLTCVLEESLFRGVLQHRLSLWFARRQRSTWWALAIASLLFGLVHAGGGLLLFAAATLAGMGYGLAYRITGRIEAPLLAHLTLNTVHYLGFTYPYTAG